MPAANKVNETAQSHFDIWTAFTSAEEERHFSPTAASLRRSGVKPGQGRVAVIAAAGKARERDARRLLTARVTGDRRAAISAQLTTTKQPTDTDKCLRLGKIYKIYHDNLAIILR